MPIYAYKCAACGFAQDVMKKMADAELTVCPHCHQSSYSKQLTAAGFQLKGNGYYATDFKTNSPASSGSETAAPASDAGTCPACV